MDFRNSSLSRSPIKCCICGCNCSTINRSLSGTYIQSTKRKHVELEVESSFTVPGFDIPQNARVEIENECTALRETVVSQQKTIQDLISDLEEERNASSSAANEAMSMILRLQSEKAEIAMEARQFKRFIEEKMAHDQQKMQELDDLLYKGEQTIGSLTFELQAYKHKLMSYGLTESEVDEIDVVNEIYPRLKCNINELQVGLNGDNNEDYAFGGTPLFPDQLKDLEFRINQLEKNPSTIQPDGGECIGPEKVIVGQSPGHTRKFSTKSSNSLSGVGEDIGHNYAREVNSNSRKPEYDRLYNLDSVHHGDLANGVKDSVGIGGDDYSTTYLESLDRSKVRDLEFQKLYARVQALEADRETMRQTVISMGTDKAHLVLLREIAQNLCKDMLPSEEMIVQKHTPINSFSIMSIFKWVLYILFWRRKAPSFKYKFGLSAHNAGLLTVLDKSSCIGQLRFVSSTNIRK